MILSISTAILLSFGFSGAALANTYTYQVKNGDTLWSIAKKNNVTVAQIKSWNKLSSDRIVPKQILRLSPQKGTVATNQPKPASSVKGVTFSKEITVTATAYSADCKGCSGITATGLNLKKNPNTKAISVDPKVIPLGTKVYVEGYGYAVAADKGSAIRGNKIDVFFPSKKQALQWGVKKVKVKIVK
jgi:3D (Asp-Asp-Asp) domain-containing protein